MRVDLDRDVVDGDLAVRFTPDIATDRLVFRLWPNSPLTARAGARLDTGTVTIGAHAVATEQPDPTTLVVTTGPLAAGKTIDVALPWTLHLPGQVNDRVSRTGDTVRLGSFFPILAWEPGVGWATDPPTVAHGEASTAPTADFSVSVELPPGVGALATGEFDGSGRWRATAVRDFGMSIGRFTVATGVAHAPDPVAMTVGVAAGIAESPAGYLDKERRALEQFAVRFGPYPWRTFTMAVTPGLSGGIEYPTHVMQGPGAGGRTTSHEVGHEWFYSLVGNDQGRDPWLDEALATWAEAGFEGTLGSFRSRSIPSDARGRAGEPMTYWDGHTSSYYRGVYVQGTQALAANGSAALVDCALRHYVTANAYRIARPADLFAALRVVFPDADRAMAPYGLHP